MKRKLAKKESRRMEIRQRAIEKAFPSVKQLAKRHGLHIVNACVIKMKEIESKRREYEEKKGELSGLEQEIKDF